MAYPTTTTTTTLIQALSVTTSLTAAGGIAILSLFDIPLLKSQPASRSLPSTRWLFSRGSHIFPQAAVLSSSGFAYLAYSALKPTQPAYDLLLKITSNGGIVNGYLAAAVLCLSIGPFTQWAMLPTNFRLIEMNAERGGKRSWASAEEMEGSEGLGNEERSAEDSVSGNGEGGGQFTDLSGPQEETKRKTTGREDEEVKGLLERFALLNWVRAVLIGSGGIVGLVVALG